jgi:RES domain-containing protein
VGRAHRSPVAAAGRLERDPEGLASRRLGSEWLSAAPSALLAVPSAIVEEERNVLVDPLHPDARRLFASKVRRFLYDPRV